MTPFRIVIVGGGTAGWLSALMLSFRLKDVDAACDITVVESTEIPTIGVGEGTTAVFKLILDRLGIDQQEFLEATGATIKFGIKHRDWKSLGRSYDGPIDDPHQLLNLDTAYPWLDVQAVANQKPVVEHHLFYHLLNQSKSPVARLKNGKYKNIGPFDYAFHFDQAKVGTFLRMKSSGVNHIDATISDVSLNDAGEIESLHASDGRTISGDFYIDCTGFRRQLIGKALGVKWKSYNSQLPVNRAMPFWLEHETEAPISPYTLAWAQKCGWLWMIPTQDRIGCGYVYSDEFTSPDEALSEIENVLGRTIEPRRDLRFDSGCLEQSWSKNCLALGLASSFLEPLEATSIHGTVVQLMLLTQNHLDVTSGIKFIGRDQFNQVASQQLGDYRDFLNLHYISERRDSAFWQYIHDNCISEMNRNRVERWQTSMPRRKDFKPLAGGLPHIEEQLYYPVLDGLGLLSQSAAKSVLVEQSQSKTRIRKTYQGIVSEYRRAAAQAIDHRKYLQGLPNLQEEGAGPSP